MDYHVAIPDIQKAIDRQLSYTEDSSQSKLSNPQPSSHIPEPTYNEPEFNFGRYHTLDEVGFYMTTLYCHSGKLS